MHDFLHTLSANPWLFLVVGYLCTITVETPILCLGLSDQHPLSRRILCGFWLTACTYPLVVLVVPHWFDPNKPDERVAYLAVAESIAHFGECALFYFAFAPLKHFWRDMAAVFLANVASFGLGELLYYLVWLYNVPGSA